MQVNANWVNLKGEHQTTILRPHSDHQPNQHTSATCWIPLRVNVRVVVCCSLVAVAWPRSRDSVGRGPLSRQSLERRLTNLSLLYRCLAHSCGAYFAGNRLAGYHPRSHSRPDVDDRQLGLPRREWPQSLPPAFANDLNSYFTRRLLQITYIVFHYVKGVPFDLSSNSGVYDQLTLWEQIDSGAQYTPAKKWLTTLPIVL